MDQFNRDFASHWDELVGWEKRSAAETAFLLELIEKFQCQNVLDVALGTGFHSVELLKNGLQVKSVDLSPAMIDVAKKNAHQHAVMLDVVCSDWTEISKNISEKFDCILCLGNSLACEMSLEKQQQAIVNWGQVLSNDGIIIVDRRNYEALLSNEYNFASKGQYFGDTVKIKPSKISSDGTVFSYTFADERTFDLNMYPLLDVQIKDLFLNAGFHAIEVYGDRERLYENKNVGFYMYVFGKIKNA
jgi:SAM-dependent methyltransferase